MNRYLTVVIVSLFLLGKVVAQKELTVGEVWDYNVGDEIHHKYAIDYSNWGQDLYFTYVIKKVTSRTMSSNLDTVTYIFDVQKRIPVIDLNHDPVFYYRTENSTRTDHITNLRDTIFNLWPMDTSFQGSMGFDSSYVDPSMFNKSVNWTYYSNGFEGGYDYTYIEGIGGWYGRYWSAPGVTERYLLYFKKGVDVWGNPITVGYNEYPEKLNLRIFPNPSNGSFQIDFPSLLSGNLSLFSIQGKLIYEEHFNFRSAIKINLTDSESSGMYLLQVMTENDVFRQQLIFK